MIGIDFFSYHMDLIAFIIYLVFTIVGFYFLKRYFTIAQSIILTLLSLLTLEMIWEFPFCILSIPKMHLNIEISTLITLRQFTYAMPVWLWFGYAIKQGSRNRLILIIIGLLVDVCFFYYPPQHVVWHFLLRLMWMLIILSNIETWRKKNENRVKSTSSLSV